MRLCFKAPELQDRFSGSFFILDIKLSTSPVPNLPGCYHASCHHNNGLNIWTLNKPQLKSFFYKSWLGHSDASQKTVTKTPLSEMKRNGLPRNSHAPRFSVETPFSGWSAVDVLEVVRYHPVLRYHGLRQLRQTWFPSMSKARKQMGAVGCVYLEYSSRSMK